MFEDTNQLMSRCPLCNAGYRMEDTQVIEASEESSSVYVECPRCKISIMAVVAMSGMGMISLGMVTDMTREDIDKFRLSPSVSGNELLEMIQLLKRQDRSVVRELTKEDDGY